MPSLDEVRSELRRLHGQQRQRRLRNDPQSGLPWRVFHSALRVGYVTDFDLDAPCAYLCMAAKRKWTRGLSDEATERLRSLLEDYFLQADDEWLQHLGDAEAPSVSKGQLRRANAYAD